MADGIDFDRLQGIGLILQGAGEGFQGRGAQFSRGLQERQTQRRQQEESARQRFLQGVGGATQMIRGGDLMGAVRLLDSIDDPNAQRAARELLAPQTSEETALDLFDLERRAIVLGDLKGPEIGDPFTLGPGQTRFGAGGEVIARGGEQAAIPKAAGTREFEALTRDLTAEQKNEARLIKLGLSPRAVGNAIQTIAANDLAELIGKTSATIKQREKFAEKTGVSRANTIDKGFERIAKIDAGVRNIDKAINALNQGAGVGAIQRFLPSFKAASVSLDNIQGLMALDVIGAVTFGALSKGELDLAKAIALPTGLDTPQLIQHLQDRKVAQQKLRDYFNEQIQFLDQGGTVAGFLRQKEREQAAGGNQATAQAQPGQAQTQGQQIPEGATATNAQGQKIIMRGGQWQAQ